MRFGGHQTFPIREGWLHKGLKTIKENPERLTDEHAADWLGVGRNMAKSINHWLVATGLAREIKSKGVTRLEISELGELIWGKDRYFLEIGTIWALHVNLVHNDDYAASWDCFFNYSSLNQFERAACIENISEHLEMLGGRMPSINTLKKDVACLLASYSRSLPPTYQDPEEVRESPFIELGILSHSRSSGYYHLHRSESDREGIPSELFGYAVARYRENSADDNETIDLFDLIRKPFSPGLAFVLTGEGLREFAERAARKLPSDTVRIEGQSEKKVRIVRESARWWLEQMYMGCAEAEHAA